MCSTLAIFAMLFVTAQPDGRAGAVRIGLFSLLKPQVVHARIASGDGARLDAGGLNGDQLIAPGDVARIRLVSGRLNITVSDSHGRVKRSLATTEARFFPVGSTTLELVLPGKMKRAVQGELSVAIETRRPRGPLKIVLVTDRESAVASTVAAELSGQRAQESFKALAVVARTFMLAHAGRHADEGFDFCDTTHCQLYRGEQDLSAQAASPAAASAVAQTEGEYLSFRDKPIEGHYSAVCGGLSATPEMVWGGASHYAYQRVACRWCQASRYARWERSAKTERVLDALSVATGLHLSQAADVRIEKAEPCGFVRSVRIRDAGRQITLSADEFRRAIGRRLGWSTVLSPTFAIEQRGQRIIFRGRGFGSQIGLCLAGAIAQAKAGRSYRKILSFYFPQAEIKDRSTHE